jgi:hypothetical protein
MKTALKIASLILLTANCQQLPKTNSLYSKLKAHRTFDDDLLTQLMISQTKKDVHHLLYDEV